MNTQGGASGKAMPTTEQPSASGSARWLGRFLSGLAILPLPFDGAIELVPWPVVTETMDRIGYGSSETLARSLGVITVACTVLYAIPPTSILGAILLTGYLGGAIAPHLRIGSPLFTHTLFGLLSRADRVGWVVVARPEIADFDALAALIEIFFHVESDRACAVRPWAERSKCDSGVFHV